MQSSLKCRLHCGGSLDTFRVSPPARRRSRYAEFLESVWTFDSAKPCRTSFCWYIAYLLCPRHTKGQFQVAHQCLQAAKAARFVQCNRHNSRRLSECRKRSKLPAKVATLWNMLSVLLQPFIQSNSPWDPMIIMPNNPSSRLPYGADGCKTELLLPVQTRAKRSQAQTRAKRSRAQTRRMTSSRRNRRKKGRKKWRRISIQRYIKDKDTKSVLPKPIDARAMLLAWQRLFCALTVSMTLQLFPNHWVLNESTLCRISAWPLQSFWDAAPSSPTTPPTEALD